MVSIGYYPLVFSGPCPHCDGHLFELSDMWGPFYACEGCGYEFDPHELQPNQRQPQGQPAFVGSFWLDQDNGSNGRRTVWQASGEARGLRLG